MESGKRLMHTQKEQGVKERKESTGEEWEGREEGKMENRKEEGKEKEEIGGEEGKKTRKGRREKGK